MYKMLIGSLVALYSNASGAEMKCMSPVGIPARDVNNLSTLHLDVKTRSSCLQHHGHGHRHTLNLSVISLTNYFCSPICARPWIEKNVVRSTACLERLHISR